MSFRVERKPEGEGLMSDVVEETADMRNKDQRFAGARQHHSEDHTREMEYGDDYDDNS